jgi:dTDP-N-acetylfucosamine:lipid II N-acetylfucosaminyltransferase
MSKEFIVHCMHAEKFIQPFIDFMVDNILDFEAKHKLFITRDFEKYSIRIRSNIWSLEKNKLVYYAKLAFAMNKADKIILHSLFNMRLIMLLAMQPWLLKRCYWVIWGGDLYSYQLGKRVFNLWCNEVIRRFTIKRLGHFITHIHGDYELAQKWYGAKGVWHECFMYPSNLYQEPPVQKTPHEGINILLGNSADPSNNHIDVLEKLRPYAAENIKIFCPLSYGDAEYAKQVADYGESIFGDKFNPLLDFMRFNDYKKLLVKIDIAIFNHRRQQGMGNITTLVGLGKSVYMRSDITSWDFFSQLGVTLFDINEFDLQRISHDESMKNIKIISTYFSKGSLIRQMQEVYK